MAETRGWCPDLFTPMQSGDGWLLRIKPLLARITAQQAREIAAAAGFGNGLLELTSRANLQLRGLTPESAHRAASDLVAWGLADPDPVRERRRNLLLSPLMPPSALAVAEALAAAICAASWLDALPAKFGFGVSAGQFLLAAAQCDLLVQAQDDHWRLSLGGIKRGATNDTVPTVALKMLRDLPATRARPRATARGPRVVGWHPEARAFGFGLPFGQLDASVLRRLAALAEGHGDGLLHLTPWRTMLIAGIEPGAVPVLRNALADLPDAVVLDPDDPRLSVSACIGSAGCGSGKVDARADALSLLRLGVRAPSIHVSGCAKGCAHPAPATLTLVGQEIRDGRGRYGLVRDGRAGDTALTGGLDCVQLALGLGRSADKS